MFKRYFVQKKRDSIVGSGVKSLRGYKLLKFSWGKNCVIKKFFVCFKLYISKNESVPKAQRFYIENPDHQDVGSSGEILTFNLQLIKNRGLGEGPWRLSKKEPSERDLSISSSHGDLRITRNVYTKTLTTNGILLHFSPIKLT